MANPQVAELGYSREDRSIELVVPHGTKMADLSRIIGSLQSSGIIGRLPRSCNTCTSGDHFTVRERLEMIVRVDLDQFKVLD
jgi:hypothetical protein